MWFVFEFLLAFAVFTVIVTQLWIPIIKGTKTFPILRHRKTEAQLAEAREAAEVEALNEMVREIEARVNASKAAHAAKEAQQKDA